MDLTKDEIEKKISRTKSPAETVDLLNYYASIFTQKDLEYSQKLAEKALKLANKLNYPRGQAQALLNKSILVYYDNDFDAMLDYAARSEYIMRSLSEDEQKEPLGLHRVINCIGICYFYRGDYKKASALFEETIRLCRAAGDIDRLGTVYNNLSTIYDKLEDPRRALEYCLKALEELEKTELYQSLVYALNNAGNYSCDLKEYNKALSFLNRAYSLAKEKDFINDEPMILVSLTKVYIQMADYTKAEDLIRKCLSQARSLSIPREEITSLTLLGTIYRKLNRFDDAKECLVEALDCIEKHNIHYYEKEIHHTLDQIYTLTGDYKKAYYHQGLYFELEKKSLDTELANKMRNFEVDFLRTANQGIKIISALGQKITSTLDTRQVMDHIYSGFNSLIDAPLFGIITYDSGRNLLHYDMYIEDGKYIEACYIQPDNPSSLGALAFRDKRDIIIGDFEKEYKTYLPNALSFEDCFIQTGNQKYPHSALYSPLIAGGRVIGLISAASYKKNAYTISDLDSVKALGSYVAIALQNSGQAELISRQNLKLSKANEKLHKDIQLSRQLQMAMIPAHFPSSPVYSIYGYVDFHDDVGGDLYDVYQITPDKTVILILDVVGHGVSAALVTAMAKILFFNKSKENMSASRIVGAVNRELTPITGGSFSYFSLFFGIIDSKKRTLEYVNAAHPEPFLIKEKGNPQLLGSSSLYVGIKEDFTYDQKTVSLDAHDRLVLFTDGFFETKGKNKQRFGVERLLKMMISTKHLSPSQVVSRLNSKLARYQRGVENGGNDDKSMLIIDFN